MRYALLAAAALASLAASNRTSSPVTIIARDFAFEAPDTIPAGLTTIHVDDRRQHPHALRGRRRRVAQDSTGAVQLHLRELEQPGQWLEFIPFSR